MRKARNADEANRGRSDLPKKPRLVDRYTAEFSGWVNITLTSQDAAEFDTWLATVDLWTRLDEAADAGYKTTFTRQWAEGCFLATVMQRDSESVNAGLMVSARSTTAGRALAKVLWIVEYLLPGEWPRNTGYNRDSW